MLLFCIIALAIVSVNADDSNEDKAKALLKKINEEYLVAANSFLELLWNFETNISPETYAALQKAGNFVLDIDDQDIPWSTIKDPDTLRQAKLYGLLKQSNVVPTNATDELNSFVNDMFSDYYRINLCGSNDDCDMDEVLYDMEMTLINSSDATELLKTWKLYADNLGPLVRDKYPEYVKLANIPAKLDGYDSRADQWLSEYERDSSVTEAELKDVYTAVLPLYQELHAYVRSKLNAKFGDSVVTNKGPIPVHLLGSFQGDGFDYLYDKILPFPNANGYNQINDLLTSKAKDLTPKQMVQSAENFFKGLGLKGMTDIFWAKSILEKPAGKEMACSASAWDLFKKDDFRIEFCSTPDMDSQVIIYNLVTEVEYLMSFADLPGIYRDKPIRGFDEALESAVRRSFKSFKHLSKIGLLTEAIPPSSEADINFLFLLASYYVPYTIYAYILDSYRRDIFRGKITSDNYNSAFWNMRTTLGGISPPEPRSEDYFDAANDLSVLADDNLQGEYNRIALTFQILKELCITAGDYDPKDPKKPLNQCDFSDNTKVGDKLSAMMKVGRSVPWFEALNLGIGQNKLNGGAIVEFFQPLLTYLKVQNQKAGVTAGW